MNTFTRKQLLVAGLLLVMIVYAIYSAVSSRQNAPPETTSFYSPISQSNDKLEIGYGGAVNPNADATTTEYRFFDIDSFSFSDLAKERITAELPTYIQAFARPAYQTTYIHIARDTIEKLSDNNYAFDFYIDNPELYFHYTPLYLRGESPVTQIPWSGIN